MSWTSQLYTTYERAMENGSETGAAMTPVAHRNVNAQLEITLNLEGEFLGARSIPRENAATLVPVTEASAGRSSGIAPHALCDTLSYVAGDFESYLPEQGKKTGPRAKFEQYIENLKKWEESEQTHPKVHVVYTYLSKEILMSDLIKSGLVELDEDGMLSEKKIEGQPYEKAMVRFRIAGSEPGKDGTWADPSLIQAYTQYYQEHQQGEEALCYFTGKKQVITKNHPKGIVAANYGAKLVSANDERGFTYRGRFQNAEQACTLSYEASQKIHSALTWLVKNQGAYIGTSDKRAFVCWNPNGKKVPHLFDEFGLLSEESEEQEPEDYKRKLIRAFQGYREQFDREDAVIVMGLDAATTGRLSVTYYNEMPALDFLDRIIDWGNTCRWFYLKFHDKKKPYFPIETPLFRRIVEYAFGRERDKFVEVDDRILKEQVQRLLKCMLEKQPFPTDIMQALVIRASTPLAYSNGNREKVLSTACAVISKYYSDRKRKGEQEAMKLDPENRDRSYLFGRLLAIYERVELATYDNEDREPNAIRLQSAYVNHPMQTWKILNDLLTPYFQKLKPGPREHYRRMISEITELLLEVDERKLNQGLQESYLLGYYLQRAELNKKKISQKEEKENA